MGLGLGLGVRVRVTHVLQLNDRLTTGAAHRCGAKAPPVGRGVQILGVGVSRRVVHDAQEHVPGEVDEAQVETEPRRDRLVGGAIAE